jgi:hypothetical protein
MHLYLNYAREHWMKEGEKLSSGKPIASGAPNCRDQPDTVSQGSWGCRSANTGRHLDTNPDLDERFIAN